MNGWTLVFILLGMAALGLPAAVTLTVLFFVRLSRFRRCRTAVIPGIYSKTAGEGYRAAVLHRDESGEQKQTLLLFPRGEPVPPADCPGLFLADSGFCCAWLTPGVRNICPNTPRRIAQTRIRLALTPFAAVFGALCLGVLYGVFYELFTGKTVHEDTMLEVWGESILPLCMLGCIRLIISERSVRNRIERRLPDLDRAAGERASFPPPDAAELRWQEPLPAGARGPGAEDGGIS